MSISRNIQALRAEIPAHVTLVAISKNKPVSDIMEAYEADQRDFGENRVQELVNKVPQLPADIRWHMVGHLQSNKVKLITPFIHMVHSVDSYKLLREINKESQKQNRIVNCLLQFHIAAEESKFGFSPGEAREMLEESDFHALRNVQIAGVMGMATFTNVEKMVCNEFRELLRIFTFLKETYFRDKTGFREISMGMSGDFKLAIEEGSTMVRIGTSIFGERTKP